MTPANDREAEALWERYEEIQGDVDIENMAHGGSCGDYEKVALSRLVSEARAQERERVVREIRPACVKIGAMPHYRSVSMTDVATDIEAAIRSPAPLGGTEEKGA